MEIEKIKLTEKDLHNLYDLMYMLDGVTYDTMKLNKMEKWFKDFFKRVERIVVPELYKKNGKRK